MTGHPGGVISVNIAEADDAERERRRHESGHYYWDRLIAPTSEIDEFRSLLKFVDDVVGRAKVGGKKEFTQRAH